MAFYGIPPEQAAKPADVQVPLQGHFANRDDWCTPAVVDAFENGLKAAGKSRRDSSAMTPTTPSSTSSASAYMTVKPPELAWGRATRVLQEAPGLRSYDRMLIRRARPDEAAEICDVLRRSIAELCGADHHDDPAILRRWLANQDL